jgi:hypothetical protein
MDVADLFVASTISNQPVAGSIIVSASKEYVLAGVLIVNRPLDPHIPWPKGQILPFWVGSAHISYAPSLSFDILDKWNIKNQCSTTFGIYWAIANKRLQAFYPAWWLTQTDDLIHQYKDERNESYWRLDSREVLVSQFQWISWFCQRPVDGISAIQAWPCLMWGLSMEPG